MVNFAVATVILVQLGMLAQTSVALPIESEQKLEGRADSDSQLSKRDPMKLERRGVGHKLALVAGLGVAALWWHHHDKKEEEKKKEEEEAQAANPTTPTKTGEPRMTGDPTEPAKTGDTAEPAKTGDTAEPTKTGDSTEPTKTGDLTEPTKTGDPTEPTESGDSNDARGPDLERRGLEGDLDELD